jgi:hypothetical protein
LPSVVLVHTTRMGGLSVPSRQSPTWLWPICCTLPCIGQTVPSLICGLWL